MENSRWYDSEAALLYKNFEEKKMSEFADLLMKEKGIKKSKLKKVFIKAWKNRNKSNPLYQKATAYSISEKKFLKIFGIKL